MAVLAAVGIVAGALLAMPGNAHADGEGWREGWCREGEGQTLVIDWRATPDALDIDPPHLIRCIAMAEGEDYPIETDIPISAPLVSAGIPFTTNVPGLFTSVNGVPTQLEAGFKWNWSTGQLTPEDGADHWLGRDEWTPEAGVDTFVAITLSAKPSDASGLPVVTPQFDLTDPTVTPTATASPTPDPSVTPSSTASNTTKPGGTVMPSNSPSPSASPSATQSATQPATQTATSTPTATNPVGATATPSITASPTNTTAAPPNTTASPTSNTTRPRRTTRPPRQTHRPQRPTYRPERPTYQPDPPNYPQPPPPPVQEPPPPPPPPPVVEEPVEPALPADPSGEGTGPANAPPSRVWGREDVTRQSTEADRPDKPAPWSQLAAVAGAVVVVGGLGTAFARGLQTSAPPVVEEE